MALVFLFPFTSEREMLRTVNINSIKYVLYCVIMSFFSNKH